MEWLNVKDNLPEEYLWVLVLSMREDPTERCPISFALWKENEWWFLDEGFNNAVIHGDIRDDILSHEITHWMHLPKLPLH